MFRKTGMLVFGLILITVMSSPAFAGVRWLRIETGGMT